MTLRTLSRKPKPPRRVREPGEYASHKAAPSMARMATAGDLVRAKPAATAVQKVPDRKQQSIRDSASGEECLVRLPRCGGAAIWSHNRHGRAGKGRGIKSLDLNGCFCCVSCDAIYDGQSPLPPGLTREAVELAWYHAHAESLVRLRQKGLI